MTAWEYLPAKRQLFQPEYCIPYFNTLLKPLYKLVMNIYVFCLTDNDLIN
jgi:hypothetical protein